MSEMLVALGMALATGLGLYWIKRHCDLKEKLTVMDSFPVVKKWRDHA